MLFFFSYYFVFAEALVEHVYTCINTIYIYVYICIGRALLSYLNNTHMHAHAYYYMPTIYIRLNLLCLMDWPPASAETVDQ